MRRTLSLGIAGTITLALAAAMPYADASAGTTASPDGIAPVAGAPDAGSRAGTGAAHRAGGAVVVGATAPSTLTGVCSGSTVSWIQKAVGPTANGYVVPGAGVITSVSHFATPQATGSMRAEFLGPGPGPDDRVVLAYTPLLPMTPNSLNTYPLRIPVPAGTSLGLFEPASNVACNFIGAPSDVLGATGGADPSTTPSFTATLSFTNALLNLSAVWEPDADGDTFGDASQDLCPQSKLTQAACPAPDITITKAPKKKSTKRKATITFASTVAGSTFTCAVDKKAAVACTSPFKKKYKYGKHTVVITATSPVGIVDPTPVTVTFKVRKPQPSS